MAYLKKCDPVVENAIPQEARFCEDHCKSAKTDEHILYRNTEITLSLNSQ